MMGEVAGEYHNITWKLVASELASIILIAKERNNLIVKLFFNINILFSVSFLFYFIIFS